MTDIVIIRGEPWLINIEKKTLTNMNTKKIRHIHIEEVDHFRSIVKGHS
jgi:hypothetical protein